MPIKKQNFFQRISQRYKVSVTDTKNLSVVYQTYGSRLKIYLIIFTIFILCFFVVLSIVLYTPAKYLVPGYPSRTIRTAIIDNALMVDSLSAEIEMRDRYLVKIQSIISGGMVKESETSDIDFPEVNFAAMAGDTIFERLIGPDKYKFSYFLSDEAISETPRINFFSPVRGVVVNRFNSSPGHFGTDIVAADNSPIMAVLEGTVIFAEWSVTTGFVVQIQHDYNIISIYKHNSNVLVAPGQRVKAGDIIAIMGGEGIYSTGPHLHIELWQNGIPLDPEKFINFQN